VCTHLWQANQHQTGQAMHILPVVSAMSGEARKAFPISSCLCMLHKDADLVHGILCRYRDQEPAARSSHHSRGGGIAAAGEL
jgi:hypothetical protein